MRKCSGKKLFAGEPGAYVIFLYYLRGKGIYHCKAHLQYHPHVDHEPVEPGPFLCIIEKPAFDTLQFTGIVCLGGISLSLVFTLLAAIAAKAQQNSALMAILGFPLIIPQLLLLIRLSKAAFGEAFREGALLQLSLLIIGFDLMVVMLAIILFPFLWKD